MRDLSTSKWRYVFLLLLVDRPRDAMKLIYRALWPEREWLIARYGRYTFFARLRHLVAVTWLGMTLHYDFVRAAEFDRILCTSLSHATRTKE